MGSSIYSVICDHRASVVGVHMAGSCSGRLYARSLPLAGCRREGWWTTVISGYVTTDRSSRVYGDSTQVQRQGQPRPAAGERAVVPTHRGRNCTTLLSHCCVLLRR